MRVFSCFILSVFISSISFGQVITNDPASGIDLSSIQTFKVGARYYSSFSLPESLPKTNLLGYWSADYGINSDSTIYLVDASNIPVDTIKLSGVDFSLSSGYIPLKTAATFTMQSANDIDTAFWDHDIYPTTVFANIDYDSTTYFKVEDHVLNSDSTELHPARITEIALYSEATDANSYFNVPDISETGVIWVAKSGGDQTTIAAAITAASVNDTIYVKSGIYAESDANSNLSVSKAVTLIGVGRVEVTASGTPVIDLTGNGTHNIERLIINGTANRANTFDIVSGTGTKIVRNCVFKAATTQLYRALVDWQCYNSIFINSGSICGQGTEGNLFEGCLFAGANTGTAFITFGNNQTVLKNQAVKYCKFIQDNSGATVKSILGIKRAGDYNFSYNYFKPIFSSNIAEVSTTTNVTGSFYVKGNYYDNSLFGANTATNILSFASSYFAKTTIKILDNEINVNDSISQYAIHVDYADNAYIEDNLINSVAYINAIYTNQHIDTVAYINNNDIRLHRNSAAIVVNTEAANATYKAYVDGNIIHGSTYYNPNFANVTHGIFISRIAGAEVTHNYVEGTNLGLVFKSLNLTDSLGFAAYNITKNCTNHLVAKGTVKNRFYNNTIYNDQSGFNGIVLQQNESDTLPSEDIKFYNNIVYDISATLSTSGCIIIDDDTSTIASNNNVIYSLHNSTAIVNDVNKTFSQWVALGNDSDSYNVTPNFISVNQLWPTTPFTGTDLGTSYNTGLNISTVWPNSVITKQQEATWQIGAYVQ